MVTGVGSGAAGAGSGTDVIVQVAGEQDAALQVGVQGSSERE